MRTTNEQSGAPTWANWGWALGALALSVAAYALLAASAVSWDAWRPASCMPDRCFCEAVRAGPVRQPANTLSALGFVAFGLGVLAARRDGDDPRLRRAYGTVLVLLGVGSVALHATLTFAGQWLDLMSMYLLPTFLGLHLLARRGLLGPRARRAVFATALAVQGASLIAWPAARRWVFGAMIAALAAGLLAGRTRTTGSRDEARAPRPSSAWWLLGAAATFAVSFVIWLLDHEHWVCAPASLAQGHAGWHLGCALAAYLLYRYLQALPRASGRGALRNG